LQHYENTVLFHENRLIVFVANLFRVFFLYVLNGLWFVFVCPSVRVFICLFVCVLRFFVCLFACVFVWLVVCLLC
jgi:hypothetical protein